jgi:hypothetical protein
LADPAFPISDSRNDVALVGGTFANSGTGRRCHAWWRQGQLQE